jgi:hypothetical protein
MTQQRPAPWVRKLAADGGLLLLDTASNCLSAYNSSAQLVWELLEQGGSETELVAGFAARCVIAHDLVNGDRKACFRQTARASDRPSDGWRRFEPTGRRHPLPVGLRK